MQKYRDNYVRAVAGEITTFKGPDEFSTEPWPIEDVWREIVGDPDVVDAGAKGGIVSFDAVITKSRINHHDLRMMIGIHQTLARHRADYLLRSALPKDVRDWDAVKAWHETFVMTNKLQADKRRVAQREAEALPYKKRVAAVTNDD